jgi:LacI family transcriptional regulator
MAERKRVRREDVARAAGVSKAVVTWVASGTAAEHKISSATVKKVERIIKKFNYRPSVWGRLINTRKSGLLAFISSNLSDPHTGEIARNLNLAARERGYGLMLFDLFGAGGFRAEDIVSYEDCLAEAFILHSPGDDVLAFCADGSFAGKPFCVLGRDMTKSGLPSVEVDNIKGAEMALRVLLEKNVRRLGVIADLKTLQYTKERLAGCGNVLRLMRSLETDFYFRKVSENQYDAGVSAMSGWLSSGSVPDAVFALAGDVTALGALSVINSSGVKCPAEIRVVGFDGAEFSKYSSPPLTTARQPFEKMCGKAVEICAALINGEKPERANWLFEPELVIRKTT